MQKWLPRVDVEGHSIYLQIADSIENDIRTGILREGDRLPTQRALSAHLDVDYSTVSRAYAEASRRGLIDSFVGRGTFVKGRRQAGGDPGRGTHSDLSLNPPPDVTDPKILAMMARGVEAISGNIGALLRYQSATGSDQDRAAAARWLSRRGLEPQPDCLLIAPGSHAALSVVLNVLTKPGDRVACETLTDPGMRTIAARMGRDLVGIACDDEGMRPDALEAALQTGTFRAVYLTPALHNPTTRTMPAARREQLSAVLIRHRVPVIEDDAWGFIQPSPPPSFVATAPELTWHISSLSRYLGAGLRLAFLLAPNGRMALSAAQVLRAFHVMPSPLTAALATSWLENGTALQMLSFIRDEARARQAIAREVLARHAFEAAPYAFSIWLRLPEGVGRADLMGRMSGCGVGIMPSDAFTVSAAPSEHVRVGLGGSATRDMLRADLAFLDEMLTLDDWSG